MIVILSTNQPTVSATALALFGRGFFRPGLRCALLAGDGLADFLVNALDQVVAALIQLVDVALRRRNLVVVGYARLVLLVPQLDVRLREARDEVPNGVRHGAII